MYMWVNGRSEAECVTFENESFGEVERHVRDVAFEDLMFCRGNKDFVELERFIHLASERVPIRLFEVREGAIYSYVRGGYCMVWEKNGFGIGGEANCGIVVESKELVTWVRLTSSFDHNFQFCHHNF